MARRHGIFFTGLGPCLRDRRDAFRQHSKTLLFVSYRCMQRIRYSTTMRYLAARRSYILPLSPNL